MLKITEVAKDLNVSYWTVRRWIKEGRLKSIKIGGSWRIEDEEYKNFLDRGRNEAIV